MKYLIKRLPYSIQKILFFPLYLIKRYRKDTIKFKIYWDEFCKTEFKNKDVLKDIQWKKFKNLIEYSYINVPYYTKQWDSIGLHPDKIQSYSDLSKIPLLTKEDIRNNIDSLIDKNLLKEDLMIHETGGSTGTPLKFYYDENTEISRKASMYRWRKYAGVRYSSDRYLYIGRASFDLIDNKEKWGNNGEKFTGNYNPINDTLFFASTNMSSEVLQEYTKKFLWFKPEYIQGYASGVNIFTKYLLSKQIKVDFVKAILVSSDSLLNSQREDVSKVFGCDIYDRYGLVEESVVACECFEHDGMHIDMEKSLIEIINKNQEQVFAEVGELIGTNLENYAMPLIRYKTGDLASLDLNTNCKCKRESYKLRELQGRKDDFILTPKGKHVSGGGLNQLAMGINSIIEYQLVQKSLDRVVLYMVVSINYSREDEEIIINRLNKSLDNSISISVEIVDTILRRKSGKFQLIKSEINHA